MLGNTLIKKVTTPSVVTFLAACTLLIHPVKSQETGRLTSKSAPKKNSNTIQNTPKILRGELARQLVFLENLNVYPLDVDYLHEKLDVKIIRITDVKSAYEAYGGDSLPSYKLIVAFIADMDNPSLALELLNKPELDYTFNKKTGILKVYYTNFTYKGIYTINVPYEWDNNSYSYNIKRKRNHTQFDLKKLYKQLREKHYKDNFWDVSFDKNDYFYLNNPVR